MGVLRRDRAPSSAIPGPSTGVAARRPQLNYLRAHAPELTIVAAVGVAVGAGWHGIAYKSLWLDEAVSARYAHDTVSALWGVVSRGDPNAGLYYVTLRLWTGLFGYSAAALRSLSLLFGLLTIPALAALGRRLVGRAPGLLACALLALSPIIVHYDQTARTYTLLLLLVTLSSLFFVELMERPRHRSYIAYVIASTLAVYAHYCALFVLLVQLLVLGAVEGRRALRREWLLSVASIAGLCAPEAIAAASKGTGAIEWIRPPTLSDLVRVSVNIGGGRMLACLLFGLTGYALVRMLAGRFEWRVAFLGAWLLIPILVDFGFSNLVQPLFRDYYLIVVVPALLLLAAAGALTLPLRALSAACVVALLALSIKYLTFWYSQPGLENFRGATDYVLAHERPGDGIVYFPPYSDQGVQYYEQVAGRSGPQPQQFVPPGAGQAVPPRLWLVILSSPATPRQQEAVEAPLRARYTGSPLQVSFRHLRLLLYRR